MTNQQIYEILASKPHNQHYLRRYIKFIEWCNKNPSVGDYTEEHHICPKSKDLFPEYKSFTQYPWNKIVLSMDRHILAHVMLWKIYGGSMAYSLHYIINCADNRVPTKYERQYSEKLKIENREYRKGTAVYKDKVGNKFLLSTDDPRIVNEGLVGVLFGHKMTEESKEKFRRAKDPYRTTQVYKFDGERQSKSILVSDLQKYIDNGWAEEKPEEYIEHTKESHRKAVSEANTGTASYFYPKSGILYGRIPHDSPIIKELGLIYIPSDRQIETAKENAIKAYTRNVGTTVYNNGVEEKKFHTHPGGNWTEGRLPRDASHDLNQRKATSEAISGSVTYNDGVTNYRIKPGETPDPSWIKGMAPQKIRYTNYTDGNTWLLLKKGDLIPTGFKKSKKPD